MSVAICAIAKDEFQYLAEWIAYYLNINVDAVFIYDNESTDGSKEYLAALAEKGEIEYRDWVAPNGVSPQLSAYRNFMSEHSSKYDYVAFFDLDEFLVVEGGNIATLFTDLPSDVGAIAVNQLVFGSSGLEDNSPEPVIERFTKCSDFDFGERRWFKSIVKTDCYQDFYSPHAVSLKSGRYIHVNSQDVIQEGDQPGKSRDIVDKPAHLNHYMLKSKQEYFEKKQKRGGGAALTKEYRLKRFSDSYFYNRDKVANKRSYLFEEATIKKLKARMELLK